MKIAVLMGGTSPERDVSLASGAGVAEGLRAAGHEVIPIDTARGYKALKGDDIEKLNGIKPVPPSAEELQKYTGELSIEAVKSPDLRDVDVVFLILHGGSGEDGTIQALLDLVEIPYTGSGVLGSAIAMNKQMAKNIFIANGIPTPEFLAIDYQQNLSFDLVHARIDSSLGYPVVLKPNNQGSSVGLSVVRGKDELQKAIEIALQYDTRLLFEKYIKGRELTVSILGDEVLPLFEIVPESGLYDYEHKYTAGKTRYVCPVDLPDELQELIKSLGMKAFKALDCAGFGRVDFRLSEDNKPYCLEVNTLPGMTKTSLVPKAAKAAGIEFPQLLERICKIAIDDFKNRKSGTRRGA
jgi:D-alanine-D-alanine ligase